eukprot:3699476-Rhodomonas_salina.5
MVTVASAVAEATNEDTQSRPKNVAEPDLIATFASGKPAGGNALHLRICFSMPRVDTGYDAARRGLECGLCATPEDVCGGRIPTSFGAFAVQNLALTDLDQEASTLRTPMSARAISSGARMMSVERYLDR